MQLSRLRQRIAQHAVAFQTQEFAVSKQLFRSKTSCKIEGILNIYLILLEHVYTVNCIIKPTDLKQFSSQVKER